MRLSWLNKLALPHCGTTSLTGSHLHKELGDFQVVRIRKKENEKDRSYSTLYVCGGEMAGCDGYIGTVLHVGGRVVPT